MKICFLAAGDSIHSHRWIRYFAERGHDVHWISLTDSRYDVPAGIHYYRLGARIPRRLTLITAALRVRSLVHAIGPDIMHAHYAGSYGLLGLLAGVHPFVVTAWGSDVLFTGRALATGWIVRRVLASADLITCDAQHMIEAMRSLGVDTSKIELNYFGIQTDLFTPGEPDAEHLGRWDAVGRPVVMSLRSLEPVYDVNTLIEAVPHIRESQPDLRVVIAGEGSRAAQLRQRVAELDLGSSIVFIGRYDHGALPRMLRSAHVYVSTALSDAGLAASTAEAMACELPVVVTDTADNSDWVIEGETGFLFPPGDAHKLADKVVRLLGDAILRRETGARARQMIVSRNDYEGEMGKMACSYKRLVGERGTPRRA